MAEKEIAKQAELLFLWDGENWNPNGDILNANAPRYDEVSRRALVSDVRIKRTIRDYLDAKGYEIFVKEEVSGKGLADGKQRVKTVAGAAEDVERAILQKCIDVRAFGGVFPVEKQTNSLTGPMQFKMSKSLHETEIVFVKGTGAFASQAGKENKTFREEYILPYAIFGTYGIVNALAATDTELGEEDVKAVLEGLWMGTKNLISRSKFGQMPRFLLKITYKEPGHYIGALDNLVDLVSNKEARNEIRTIDEYRIDLIRLIEKMDKAADKIAMVEYWYDEALTIEPIPETWQRRDFGI
ncbi:type I-B CRISPR-associated protein Cas7/Csh2 [Hydrogenimonas cancrithermarum]|uniref:Type I-B CRISPR-associated protein Cas7/Csh2 n=1 Tax=Hydrogenimonas cancrithermarum TaxID=2993563 RepID=A0ABN6WXH6_9BACT|nr:type I-B CRISPR-associated protein Cas7/Csh2 [Hydrogenimonas cancrithermarum]BDY12742.1 type I-B CRISPR-associated protein Cas7/Csh2 [Hydrogenimonas cancrithermarum]